MGAIKRGREFMTSTLAVLLFQSSDSAGAIGLIGGLVGLAVGVAIIASIWVVFTKAGQPGWACLVPIYNFVVMCRIAGKPGWWCLLMLVPLVNLVIIVIVNIAFAEKFGKGTGFGLGLTFLGFIFFPILAWGDARYTG